MAILRAGWDLEMFYVTTAGITLQQIASKPQCCSDRAILRSPLTCVLPFIKFLPTILMQKLVLKRASILWRPVWSGKVELEHEIDSVIERTKCSLHSWTILISFWWDSVIEITKCLLHSGTILVSFWWD